MDTKTIAFADIVLADARVRGHKVNLADVLEWGHHNRPAAQFVCQECHAAGLIHEDRRGLLTFKGALKSTHCPAASAMTFMEATAMFNMRDDQSSKSHLMRPDERLVRLDNERYAVQFKNTFVVRICGNGHYVLNTSGRMTPQIIKVLEMYSPIKRLRAELGTTNPRWEYQDQYGRFHWFTDNMVVDWVGQPKDSPQPEFKEIAVVGANTAPDEEPMPQGTSLLSKLI